MSDERIVRYHEQKEKAASFPKIGFGMAFYDETEGSLAGRLAAIDAVRNALPFRTKKNFIEIGKQDNKKPIVQLHDDALFQSQLTGINEIPISITHDHGIALAIAAVGTDRHPNLRVGIDVTFKSRFQKIAGSSRPRVFTADEREESNGETLDFAKRWAIKEAVSKVLGTGHKDGVYLKSIVTKKQNDSFDIQLLQKANRIATEAGLDTWNIRTVENGDMVASYVIAYTQL